MNYWEFYLEPTKYTDDIYHIGAKNAPCWLIKSTDGLILLDTGLPKTLYMIMKNIADLGFDYRDIKHILHSHGHIDHIGGTRALVELTGAKTYIGAGDVDMVRGVNELQWASQFGMPFEEPFEPDVIIHDGDVINIGDKEFLFREIPGHTAGTLAIFFNTVDGGKTYRAGTFGGAGLGSMRYAYLDKYNLPHSIRETFIKSLDSMMDEKVEVNLGNHLGDNKHAEKLLASNENGNPFIETESWRWFLEKRKAEAIKLFEEDEANYKK